MTGKSTIRRLIEIDGIPKNPRDVETLVEGGLILTGLALGDFVHRRFRMIALGACAVLCVSALTGYSPLSLFMKRKKTIENEETDDEELGFDDEAPT
ncbi:MAG: hypothetical protein ACAI25_02220, partial [Planctomycetota bacterium]